MSKHITRITRLTVMPLGDPLHSEMATEVRISSEGDGEYIEVEQCGRTDIGKIAINPDEWPALRRAIDKMVRNCKAAA